VQMLRPFLAESDLEMRFPKGTLRGQLAFID
jgi:hypothetical protein